MATSKTYFVAWDEMLHNSVEIDRQLTEAGLDFLVFDVTTEVPIERPNWVVAEKVRYYGHFYNALKDFKDTDHLLFSFNAGDAFTDSHAEMTNRFTEMMAEDENIWVMAPDLIWPAQNGKISLLAMSKKYDKVELSIHVDGTIVMLRRDAALRVLSFYEWMLAKKIIDFNIMHSGHSIDVIYCTLAILNNKKVYVDKNFPVTTKNGSSYNTDGNKEGAKVMDAFADYMFLKGVDPRQVRHLYNMFYKTFYSNTMAGIELTLIYQNTNDIESLDI